MSRLVVGAKSRASTDHLGFLLAKASQRWNQLLANAFAERGFPQVRPAYGSILLPLFEEDGQRMLTLADRARLPKQTMTTLIRQMERDDLIRREQDPADARATRVWLTPTARAFQQVAEGCLADLDARVAGRMDEQTLTVLRAALREVMDL
jgi:DNA-binding MarR family transcriptional regulator